MNSIMTGLLITIFVLFATLLMRPRSNIDQSYNSFEMRKLPCGKIMSRSVQEKGDRWIKKVILYNSNGTILITKMKEIEPNSCRKIKAGIFVPGLWEKDGALGCIRQY